MADHPHKTSHNTGHITSHNSDHEPEPSEDEAEKLERFKKDIVTDADPTIEQREAANSDMRFVNVDGGMWEDFLENEFHDKRVKLELDLVSNFLMRFIGEWNLNRVGVEYKPNNAATSIGDSDLINGIYRSDFRQHSGKLATDNAVNECSTCGVGAMKMATVFEDEEDPENDNQRIEWRPIEAAYNNVIWDLASKRIDKRDARHCNELSQFTHDDFVKKYPGKQPVSAYTSEAGNFNFHHQSFRAPKMVSVATRYEVIKERETVFVYNDLQADRVEVYSEKDHELIKDELASNEFKTFVRERKIMRQYCEKTVFSGEDILEKTRRIAGKWIPIVPFFAIRMFVDGEEWYRGLVRKLKDAARLFNMQVSQLAENSASAGQEVPIFDPAQMEGKDVQEIWANKNNKPYLVARSLRDNEGNIVQAGPVGYSKPAQLDSSTTTLLTIVPQFVADVTGGTPKDAFDKNMSGKAITALIKRENMNTQMINDNISDAIAWSGEIYQSMAAEVYTTSRIVTVISKDGTESQEQLLQEAMDEETGKLIQINNLSGKRFQSYADVGPQYETLSEQTVEEIKGMIATVGDMPGGEKYMPVMVSVMLQNITGVGLDALKEFNRKIMLEQGMVKPQNPEEVKMLEAIRQKQGEPDPQQVLVEAAAQQQQAEARNLDAASIEKGASTELKVAQAAKTFNDINMDRLEAGQGQQKLNQDANQAFIDAQEEARARIVKQATEGLAN